MKKYIKIKESILSDIRRGISEPGQRLPNRDELVKRYKVTRATLSKALGELKKEGWITAVRNRGTFVGHGPSEMKIALVSGNLPDAGGGAEKVFFYRLGSLSHYILSMAPPGLALISPEKAEKNIDLVSDYDLVVWLMPKDDILGKLRSFSHKVLIVNRYMDSLNFISTNHRRAVYDVTDRFIRKFKDNVNLFYLDIEKNDFISSERREGFLAACSENRKYYRTFSINPGFENILDTVLNIELERKYRNVIISPTSYTTGAVLSMAYMKDLKPGRDFFYSDFDNADSLINTGVSIPSVLQDYRGMAREVVRCFSGKKTGLTGMKSFIPYKIVNFS